MERHQIDGEWASVLYLDPNFQPVDQSEATMVQVHFDNGRIMFATPTPVKTLAAESSIQGVAESHEAKFSVAFRYAFARARKAMKTMRPTISPTAIVARGEAAMVEALDEVLPKMLHSVAADGGQVGLDILTMRVAAFRAAADGPFRMRFDAKNPSVIEWAKRHAAELIKQITETTRDRIRLAIEELQEEGDWEFAHDRILAAVGDEARADLIARHETMLAAGEGQRLGWEQAEDQGLLTGKERREWIITDDERTCPECMALAGTTALLNGTYVGGIVGPPAHVQCRCTEGIIG